MMDGDGLTGIAWATSVKVDVLAAHLQSYIETKPSVDALQMCHRFGHGERAYITMLPTEVVHIIAQKLRWSDVQQVLKECSQRLMCCEDSCETGDHFSRKELIEIHKEMRYECGCDSAYLSDKRLNA